MRRPIIVLSAALLLSGAAWAALNPELQNLTRKHLDAPTEIQGYPCAAGYTWFFAGGELRECAVTRTIQFGDLTIPKDSWINLHRDGRPDFVFLAHDSWVGGYLCKGGGLLGPTEGAMTTLYPDGRLQVCWLAKDTVIQGVPCSHASMLADAFGGGSATEFHENGKLKSCKVSRDFPANGHVVRGGEHIQLDALGQVTGPPGAKH